VSYGRDVIRLARPWLGEEEEAAVFAVLRGGMLVQGERVAAFEAAVAERCGRRHGVAVSSGASALELALRALGVEDGEVLVPDLTSPSPAHAASLCGATPIPVDVDPEEWNPGPGAFAAARSPRTRAAVVIDQLGFPARHEAIAGALRGLPVVEDAACALGATLGDRPCGSFGEVACLSFHPRKLVTTGEGGMCLTDDDGLAATLRTLRNHGQTSPAHFLEAAGNHRMTELAAAVGRVQLDRLDAMLERRRARMERYRGALPELAWQRPAPDARPSHQTAGVLLPEGEPRRDQVIARLRERGVEAGRLSFALHRLPSVPRVDGAFPRAEALADRGLALPLHHALTDETQDVVVGALRSILSLP